MNVTGLYFWQVNIGSGDGLVPSGNESLPEPMLSNVDPDVATWHHSSHNELTKATHYHPIFILNHGSRWWPRIPAQFHLVNCSWHHFWHGLNILSKSVIIVSTGFQKKNSSTFQGLFLEHFFQFSRTFSVLLQVQSIKKFISASLLFNRFIEDVMISLLQLDIIYEGQ